jgi:hypothetical protein
MAINIHGLGGDVQAVLTCPLPSRTHFITMVGFYMVCGFCGCRFCLECFGMISSFLAVVVPHAKHNLWVSSFAEVGFNIL